VKLSSHRRLRLGLSALAAAALLVAACGGDDSSADPTTTAAGAATTAAEVTTTAAAGEAPATTAAAASDTTEAATTAAPDADVETGGTLTFGLSTDPLSVNPRGGGAGNDQLYVVRQLFDSLVEQDPATGKIQPWLASSWEISPDATTFTFHLRDDVTFSDGTPLTAQVVKANFDDIVAAGAKASWAISYFTDYVGTTVVDDHTAEVTFKKANAPFLQAAATSGLGIVAEATLAIPFDDRATGPVIGTGPFVLDHYTTGSEVVLNKRTGYAWAPEDRSNQGDAYLDQIVFKIIPEASVRTGALQSGQVASIGGVPPQDVQTLRDAGFDLAVRANPGVVFGLTAVQDKAPFDDVRVRQAVAKAIDTTDVRDTVLSPDFAVATSVLSSTTPGYTAVDSLITYDPDGAAALLDEAGWVEGSDGVREKDGVKLHLVLGWITNFGPNQAALELIQAQLAESGIEVELRGGTAPEFLDGLSNGTFDILWGNLSRADGDVLRTNFSTAASNYYKINDPELEPLLQQQLSIADPTERDAVLAQIQERIVEQAHDIPVFELTTVLGLSTDTHDVTLGADSRLNQLTDAWISS
jgi:peptide/nickel transport system substrate-binding protein